MRRASEELDELFKSKFLRNIMIISIIIPVVFLSHYLIFIQPSFAKLMIKSTEENAIRIARHLSSTLISEKAELKRDAFPINLLREIEMVRDNFMLESLKIFLRSGEIIYSSNAQDIGKINEKSYFHEIVARGNVYTKFVKKSTRTLEDRTVKADVVETYFPLMRDDQFTGAFEIYYDITNNKEKLDRLLLLSAVILFSLAIGLMVAMFIILFEASKTMVERRRAGEALRVSEKRYRELSITDSLTNLYNSRHFYNRLKSEIERAMRYKRPLSLLLLDIDDFKGFNDKYGHLEGDKVLAKLGEAIRQGIRKIDSGYRYGGEEFTVILPEIEGREALNVAERIRREFESITLCPTSEETIHMTVSVGVAQYVFGEELPSIVRRADKAMYMAKEQGKNRVSLYNRDII